MNKIHYHILGLFLIFFVSSCNDDNDSAIKPTGPVSVEYLESDSIFFNPERGFYTFNEFRSDNSNALSLNGLKNMVDNGISLAYTCYTMLDYRESLIPEEFLLRIRDNMELLREAGVKSILRFRYTNSESQVPWDASEDFVREHILQLTPLLQEYSDVIAVLEAGFIGVWGEWYYTENFNFRPAEDEYEPRKRVLDALLDAMPKNRMVLVRYPAAKLYTYGLEVADSVSLATAHNESNISRIGFHNDCFLADQDDRGTFSGKRSHRTYWASETKYVAMGGETCGLSSYSECSNALEEMAKYHWSFINQSYHGAVIADWNKSGCMPEIQRRLGYRFVLNNGVFTDNGHAGGAFEMSLKLKNIGFAAPYNPRDVEVVFVSTKTLEEYKIKLDNDPRFWFPQETIEISTVFGLPPGMPVGEYDVFLHLPDPEPNLYGRKEFSIRLANEDVWDDEKGFNKLVTVSIKAPSTDDDYSGKFLERTN